MKRSRNVGSSSMALTAIGTILFIAMGIGLIVSSVLWRNAVNASQVRQLTYGVVIDSITNGNFTDTVGNIQFIFGGVQSIIVIYPTFYTVSLSFSGFVVTNDTSSVVFIINNAALAAYPLQDPPLNPSFPISTGVTINTGNSATSAAQYFRANNGLALRVEYTPSTTDGTLLLPVTLTYAL